MQGSEQHAHATPPHVVVVGGGIAGLAAAHRLLGSGVRVTLLEASGRLGGKLMTGEVAGVQVDLGAESMLARRPEAVGLARDAGLGDRLQPPATAAASLWTRGALRPMPKGHVMGVPGDPEALREVLSPEGVARIAQERELTPTAVGDDVAIGAYVADRLGREVVDRLVEPLLGGVYAGDAYRISLRAALPQLFDVAREEARSSTGCAASRSGPPPGSRTAPSSRGSPVVSAPSPARWPTPCAPAAARSSPPPRCSASPVPQRGGTSVRTPGSSPPTASSSPPPPGPPPPCWRPSPRAPPPSWRASSTPRWP